VARTKKKRPEKNLVHDRIMVLEAAIADVRGGRKTSPRTARLVAGGLPRMAQKLAEEATEVVIEAVRGERSAVINESVDLLYNLVVLWGELGITASEVWAGNGSPTSPPRDGRKAAEGNRGGLDVICRALAPGFNAEIDMRRTAGHPWDKPIKASSPDDCRPFRAGNFRLRWGAGRLAAGRRGACSDLAARSQREQRAEGGDAKPGGQPYRVDPNPIEKEAEQKRSRRLQHPRRCR
jgi:phosphoribosyl-ATP pyrophosphohydrolase